MTAFPTVRSRQAFIARLDGPEPPALNDHGLVVHDAIASVAADSGISESLIHLVAMLCEDEPAFLRMVVEATPDGADTLATVRRWVMHLCRDVEALIEDPGTIAAGRSVIALHERASAGEPLIPKEWRAARAAFSVPGKGIAASAGSIAAAAAWDFEQHPGAAADVVIARNNLALEFADAEIAWRPEEDALLQAYNERWSEYLSTEVGTGSYDDADYMARMNAASARFRRENPTDLLRSQEIKDRWLAETRDRTRKELLSELASERAGATV